MFSSFNNFLAAVKVSLYMVALLYIKEILHYIAIAYIGELPNTSTPGMHAKKCLGNPFKNFS